MADLIPVGLCAAKLPPVGFCAAKLPLVEGSLPTFSLPGSTHQTVPFPSRRPSCDHRIIKKGLDMLLSCQIGRAHV